MSWWISYDQTIAKFSTRDEAEMFMADTQWRTKEKINFKVKETSDEKECCATCTYNQYDSGGNYCRNSMWNLDVSSHFDFKNMKCNEWEARG